MLVMLRILSVLCCLGLILLGSPPNSEAADRYKVLVVFSGAEGSAWEQEIGSQLKADLGFSCELTFFYLDHCHLDGKNEQQAAEAYALYQRLQPDGVIAVDDAAQTLFVLPYLKDKVSTPVVFTGIYADPEKFGYPASNVTGVRRHLFIDENIAFSRQLYPQARNFAVVTEDTPCAEFILQQVIHSYPQAGLFSFLKVTSLEDMVQKVSSVKPVADLLLLLSLDGLSDESGRKVSYPEMLAQVNEVFAGPTASPDEALVRAGALSGVLVSSTEAGQRAGAMLLNLLRGTAVSNIPVTRNYRGTRMINVKTLTELGLNPDPLTLRGTKLVTMP